MQPDRANIAGTSHRTVAIARSMIVLVLIGTLLSWYALERISRQIDDATSAAQQSLGVAPTLATQAAALATTVAATAHDLADGSQGAVGAVGTTAGIAGQISELAGNVATFIPGANSTAARLSDAAKKLRAIAATITATMHSAQSRTTAVVAGLDQVSLVLTSTAVNLTSAQQHLSASRSAGNTARWILAVLIAVIALVLVLGLEVIARIALSVAALSCEPTTAVP